MSNRARSGGPPAAVFALLIRPEEWHRFYGNAWRIRPSAGAWPDLRLGTRFTWVTFGAPVDTVVTEFTPPHRLAWSGTGLGARGHHAWILQPADQGGTLIHTRETQRGRAPRLLRPTLVPAMRRMHQRWVDGLGHEAAKTLVGDR